MSFIQPYWFKVEMPPPAVMDFIAKTSPDIYCFIPAGGRWYFGVVLSEDVIDYLLNEFTIISFEQASPVHIQTAAAKPGCRIWGNTDLVSL
jgi:hypothetical protein